MRPSIAICPARLDSTRNPPVKPGGKKRAVEECWQSTRWHFALNTRIRTHGIGIAHMQDSPLRRICFGPVINECPAAPKAASAPAPTSSQIGGVGYCKQRMCELSFAFFYCFCLCIWLRCCWAEAPDSHCADLGKSRGKLAENPVATGSPPIDLTHSASAAILTAVNALKDTLGTPTIEHRAWSIESRLLSGRR